ncbi:MAG: iron-sulfur cluster assembly accessory protein, partial [Methylocystis sp.]|nr:iron-sulfur cluster assembly accessory protein [Methylocystis sp.]
LADARAGAGLRVSVEKGGCAGMSYKMEIVEPGPGDEIVEDKGARVIVDAKAVLFLLGARMDVKTTKFSSTFVFDNPNQSSACGCGESVALSRRM